MCCRRTDEGQIVTVRKGSGNALSAHYHERGYAANKAHSRSKALVREERERRERREVKPFLFFIKTQQ